MLSELRAGAAGVDLLDLSPDLGLSRNTVAAVVLNRRDSTRAAYGWTANCFGNRP